MSTGTPTTERRVLGVFDGTLVTGSDRAALRARPTAMLILSAENSPGQPADESIAAFRQSTGPLSPWVDRIIQSR